MFIAGIDGLEYELVVRWRLRGLMQRYYGRHDVTVAVRPGEPLYTPFIWASFLLGRPSYELGFSYSRQRVERDAQAYPPLLRLFYKLRVRLLGYRSLGIRRLLVKLGLYSFERAGAAAEKYETMPGELVEHTFVAKAEKMGYRVWFKEFPSLRDPTFAQHRVGLTKLFDADYGERIRFLYDMLDRAEKDFHEAARMLDEYDLVLYYTSVIDEAHHLIYRPDSLKLMTVLRSIYGRVEKMIAELAGKKGGRVAILVVSDHGYDSRLHEHSPYGYWSLNVEPPRRPEKVTDFHDIVLELLEKPPKG
ncbi:alkaline phosphatase family protein [Hyperthermus butylicus]|uniref:alkaline phosphatase family protein n=1 Tax=Hyperthermus butylicus TaxID=54248 RepID=UPI001E3BEE4E|nr:alkaline phosphatase family protein [Hyperthermus butylicus]